MWEVITSELHLSQIESFTPFLHSFAHTHYTSMQETVLTLENPLSSHRG